MTNQQIHIPKYTTIVQLQETTDGGICYVAYHPELPNCMSQGTTAQEAEENLAEATEMVIEHLTNNDLPIPKPLSWSAFDTRFQGTKGIRETDASLGYSSGYESVEETLTVPSVDIFELQPAG